MLVELSTRMQITKWPGACSNGRMNKSDNQRHAENSAGQSGDDQGLSDNQEASSESVKELVDEGQYMEADVVDAIENAPDADVAEVHTRQVREDDVPQEYLDQD